MNEVSVRDWNEFGERAESVVFPVVSPMARWESEVRQQIWWLGNDNPGLSIPELDKLFEQHADKQPAQQVPLTAPLDFGADPRDLSRIEEEMADAEYERMRQSLRNITIRKFAKSDAVSARIESVAAAMAEQYDLPIVDWNVVDDDHVELLDKDDVVLKVVTSDDLTGFYNSVE
jgi:hypothetical protein